MDKVGDFTLKPDFGNSDTRNEEETLLDEETIATDTNFAEEILWAMNATDDELYTLANEVADRDYLKMKKEIPVSDYASVA